MNAGNDRDNRDYVPPEPPQDEPVHTYGIGRIVTVALSAVAAVVLWDAGFDDVFANSTTWGQIGMIVSGGGLVVAFKRFARLAELHFEAWQLMRRIDRLLE
jgi:hypothetical protein